MKVPRKSIRALVLAFALAAAGLLVPGTASAAPAPATCYGGPVSGYYSSLTIAGDCYVVGDLYVQGNLTLKANSQFHGSTPNDVRIQGSVNGLSGSTFELGCTEAHPCDYGVPSGNSYSVYGDVLLSSPHNAAINGVFIGRNLTSTGGGPGTGPSGYGVNFSVKDDNVGGSVSVSNLSTFWFGIIRTYVNGSVTLSNIRNSNPDGNEVVSNVIYGNLICSNNTPPPQIGDAGQPGSYVGGRALGQCAAPGLTGPPPPAP